MSEEYVTRVTVDIDGVAMEDFKNFKENSRVVRKQVNLMHKTGFAKLTPRYGFSLDYVVPSAGTEYDFAAVQGSTVTVELEGGRRRTYTGAHTLEVGETSYDGENESVKTITFGADNAVDE